MTIKVSERCTGCGACIHVCPSSALRLETERPNGFGKKRAIADARRCDRCGACIPQCRHQALDLFSGVS